MINEVRATGILIDTRRGEDGYPEILILIRRFKQDKAFARFRLDTTIDPSVSIGMVVDVKGYIAGHNVRKETGEWRVVRYMVATSIKLAKPTLEKEFGEAHPLVKGHFPPKHQFIAKLEGELNKNIEVPNNWRKLGLKVFKGREVLSKPFYITIDLGPSPKYDDPDSLKKGDIIVAYLNLWTPVRVKDGEQNMYENLVIEDYAVVEHREPSVPPVQDADPVLMVSPPDSVVMSSEFLLHNIPIDRRAEEKRKEKHSKPSNNKKGKYKGKGNNRVKSDNKNVDIPKREKLPYSDPNKYGRTVSESSDLNYFNGGFISTSNDFPDSYVEEADETPDGE